MTWYKDTMSKTVKLQVLISEDLSERLDELRGGSGVSEYLRYLIDKHVTEACSKCGK